METISEQAVSEALRAEGVEAKRTAQNGWLTTFQVDESQHPVTAILVLPPGGDYFVCFSPIICDELRVTLKNLKAERVRALLRANSAIRLAKVEYQEHEGHPFYYAVSECSTDGFSGIKLKNRLEACAALAAQVIQTVK